MSKKRYFISVILGFIFIIWGMAFGGNPLLLYWDLPSFILTPLLPYIIMCLIFPFKEQNMMFKEVFKTEGSYDKKLLEKSIVFFSTFKKLTIVMAIIATFIGFIGIMGYLSEMTDAVTIGKNLGVLSICPFYTAIFLLVYVEPLKGAAKKNLIG